MKMIKIRKIRQDLFNLIKSKAYSQGKFKLSSGKITNYYIDCRKVTLTSQGAYLTASLILDIIKNKKIQAIGGPTIGADPIVGAVTVLSLVKYKRPINGFLIRKSAKSHGLKRKIEGPQLKKGSCVVVVDDVATTGDSLVEAIKTLRKMSLKVDKAVVLVDRNEGARENLENINCDFISIFNIEEFKK